MRKLSIHVHLMFFFLLFLIHGQDILHGQETISGPDEPEILAPELILEIEDVSSEEISAPLPPAAQLPLPEFKLPSPEAEIGDLEILTVSPVIPELRMALPEDDAAFFSEAIVGGGVNNSLTGDISLYKLGEGPRFSLRFLHDGKDGYSGERSGSGFFDRTDLLQADIRLSGAGAGEFSADGSYEERENGLQGQMNNARSFIRRSSFLNLQWRSPDTSDLLLTLAGTYRDTRALFAGVEEHDFDELFLSPWAELRYQPERFALGLRVDYRFHDMALDSPRHLIDASLLFSLPLPTMEIDLQGGILWDFSTLLRYPFALSLSGAVGTFLNYNSSAGFRLLSPLWYDYWELLPYWASSSLPDLQEQWFWDGSLEWKSLEALGLRGSWSLIYGNQTPKISSFSDDITGGGPFSPIASSGLAFAGEGSLFWPLFPELILGAGYGSWWGAAPAPLDQPGRIFSYLEYGSREGDITGRLYMAWNFLSSQQLPLLDLTLSWLLADGIQTSLEGRDLLEPFLDSGRIGIDPFIEEGASLSLKLKISL